MAAVVVAEEEAVAVVDGEENKVQTFHLLLKCFIIQVCVIASR